MRRARLLRHACRTLVKQGRAGALAAFGPHAPKVFKWTTVTLGPGQPLRLQRSHAFRPITTRRHHPGMHVLGVRINGAGVGGVGFELRIPWHIIPAVSSARPDVALRRSDVENPPVRSGG